MKKKKLLLFIVVLTSFVAFGQIKPSLMIMPADNFMSNHKYEMKFENQGSQIVVNDYSRALREHNGLQDVIDKIGGLWAERGFPLEDLGMTLKSIAKEAAIDNVDASSDGQQIAKNPVEKMLETASPDIKFTINYSFAEGGFDEKSCTFTITAFDAYTNKNLGSKGGTGEGDFSSNESQLVAELVYAYMDGFVLDITSHFQGIIKNGREVSIVIKNWDSWGENLESEFGEDEEELGVLIEDWMADNTVDGGPNLSTSTANRQVYKQVMIPLFYERKGRQRKMDTKKFAQGLQKYLKSLDVPAKVRGRGLGMAEVIIGGK
tara:strand:- start:1670 stop:2626 length:957 start_codon:yes stop_codon:yes gene_type:complete